MAIRQRFYIGLINDRPAYITYTNHSITCELFVSRSECKKRFEAVCRLEIEPCITTLVGTEIPPKGWWVEQPRVPDVPLIWKSKWLKFKEWAAFKWSGIVKRIKFHG